MANLARAHIIVSGLVQGVCYRASTAEKAMELCLVGWVKNLPNGNVEIVAEGEKEIIEKLARWCEVGPPAAKVSAVDIEWQIPSGKEFQYFSVNH